MADKKKSKLTDAIKRKTETEYANLGLFDVWDMVNEYANKHIMLFHHELSEPQFPGEGASQEDIINYSSARTKWDDTRKQLEAELEKYERLFEKNKKGAETINKALGLKPKKSE